MKTLVLAAVLGLLAVLMESSLWYAPWLVIYAWQVTRVLEFEQSIWLILIAGLILDILLVMPVGLSSLALLILSIVFWAERTWFANSLQVDIFFLLLASVAWLLWRGQSWWGAAVLLSLTLFSLRFTNQNSDRLRLRRL